MKPIITVVTSLFVLVLATVHAAAAEEIYRMASQQKKRTKVVLPPKDFLLSQNAFKVPYLGYDGVFTLDPAATVPFSDPRNPKRIVMRKMEYFSFYRDLDGNEPLAENCRYVYRGSAGDPYYFYVEGYKHSIWDLFELNRGEERCKAFYYVIARPPHGDPKHMHIRYGGENSSFRSLLANSSGPEDPTRPDPWWSVYCEEGVIGCD